MALRYGQKIKSCGKDANEKRVQKHPFFVCIGFISSQTKNCILISLDRSRAQGYNDAKDVM